MSGSTWSYFFWNDWESDPALRVCSLAAQGLWMRMLCVAASHDPIGYVAVAGNGLELPALARISGESESEVQNLLGELDRAGVFSRDRHGRIYCRRMVRDARKTAARRKGGRKGGRITYEKRKGIFGSQGPPPVPISQNQNQEEKQAKHVVEPRPATQNLDALENALRGASGQENNPNTGLLNLAPILGLLDAGYQLESDVLPVLRAKRGAKAVRSWSWYVPAIHDARGHRTAAASVPAAPRETDGQRWRRMYDTWTRYGAAGWSPGWGATPDMDGCQIPRDLLDLWAAPVAAEG